MREFVVRKNVSTNDLVIDNDRQLDHMREFVYQRSRVAARGDCDLETKASTSKASQSFAILKPIWSSAGLGIQTEIRVFECSIFALEDHFQH